MGHCKVCDDYESKVMAGDEAEPCDDYEMSQTFKSWVITRMQDEVMSQVNSSGLNRMAIVKDGSEKET